MSLSSIVHRKQAKDEIMKAIDKQLAKAIKHADFDMQYALIEQRNRVAKIFGHDQKGLQAFKTEQESPAETNGETPPKETASDTETEGSDRGSEAQVA